jgi:hypothetical protein
MSGSGLPTPEDLFARLEEVSSPEWVVRTQADLRSVEAQLRALTPRAEWLKEQAAKDLPEALRAEYRRETEEIRAEFTRLQRACERGLSAA